MNVLLLIMDSVQAKNTSLHNHSNDTTPFLSELSDSATTYKQARAPSFFSLPSHASMFSGLHAVEHGATSKTDSLSHETIFERLGNKGYSTGLFSSNVYLSKDEFGLNRGFDYIFGRNDFLATKYPHQNALNPLEYRSGSSGDGNIKYILESLDSEQPLHSLLNGAASKLDSTVFPYGLSEPNESQVLTDKFLNWHGNQTQDWAAVINFMDTHFPYLPKKKHNLWGNDDLLQYQENITNPRIDFLTGEQPWWIAKALESVYDGTIRQVDQAISRIYSELSRRGEVEDTLIIITSDHGEGFGERSRIIPDFRIVGHAAGLHEMLTHVPLLVQFPGQRDPSTINEVATIRKIYDLIEQFVDGNYTQDVLCPENVLSFASLTDRIEQLSAENAVGKLERTDLPGKMYAVYRNTDNGVNKYVKFGDSKNLIRIRNAHEAMLVDAQINNELIESVYDDLDYNASDTSTKISQDTSKHLEDLGYL